MEHHGLVRVGLGRGGSEVADVAQDKAGHLEYLAQLSRLTLVSQLGH